MAYVTGKKMLNICILDILRKYTDSGHTMEQKDIIRKLKEDYDMTVDRKSVKANLDSLCDYGFDIEHTETVRQKKDGSQEILTTDWYYRHEFDDAELRMMIDSILFSKTIPEAQVRVITEKIAGLSNIYFSGKMKHISSLPSLTHTSNSQTVYNVSTIDDAITRNRQISFVYNNYGADKKLHPRREEPYTVNPYQMVANDGRFYLVCNYDKYDNLANYRIDKMTQVKMLDSHAKPRSMVKGMEHGLNLPKHMAEHIYMFSDDPVTIVMKVQKESVSEVVDWFGRNFEVIKEDIAEQYAGVAGEPDDDIIYVRLVCSGEAMFHWAMQYGPSVEVVYPDELRKKIGDAVRAVSDKYNR